MAGRAIQFTPELLESLRKAYNEAVAQDRQKFEWNGHKWKTHLAKHMIGYLDWRFHGKPFNF